jgi:hypothetical protein
LPPTISVDKQFKNDRASVIHRDSPVPALLLSAPIGGVVEPDLSQILFERLVGVTMLHVMEMEIGLIPPRVSPVVRLAKVCRIFIANTADWAGFADAADL